MAQEVLFTKSQDGRLMPADGLSAEMVDGLPVGPVFGATIKRKRNVQHLRKYWALLDAVWPSQALYATTKKLDKGIKLAVGLTEEILNPATLEYETEPGSISFSEMDQDEFNQYYERALGVIMDRILPGIDRADIERRVLEIMEGRG